MSRRARRIAIFSESTTGGVWQAALADAVTAIATGAEVRLLAPSRGPQPDVPPGITLTRIDFPRSIYSINELRSARRSLRSALRNASLVHVHGLRAALLAWPSRPMVVTYHGAEPTKSHVRSLLLRGFLRLLPRLVNRTLSVVPLKGWEIAWYPRMQSTPPTHRRYGDQVNLLWFGRVSTQKRFDRFLDLYEGLISLGWKASASVAGEFDDNQNQQRERAAALGVVNLGHVTDVASLLAGDWVVCLFSFFEGRPFSIEEAIESGLPVIVSDLPGNRMMIDDDRFLVTTHVEAIAAASLLKSPEDRHSVGDAARRTMQKRRSEYAYDAKISSIYARGGKS